jgi:ethanolamine utilization protein EutN
VYLGRVIGTVVASQKAEGLEGLRLMLVQPLSHDRKPRGTPVVAVDAVNAGPGDVVHLVSSREAALACPEPFVPVDAAICGIVDALDVEAP